MAAKKVISNLPAPEVDITKTPYFMNFPSSGGPFCDAALHNQAATIKLLQSVRKDLAAEMPFDEIKQKHKWKYVEDVKQIMTNEDHVQTLVDIAQAWQKGDENGIVLTHSERLQEMANSLFMEIKSSFSDSDWDEPDLIVEDSARQLVTLLKNIGQYDEHKRDLELAIAHWMKDNDRQIKKPAREKKQTELGARDPSLGQDDAAHESFFTDPVGHDSRDTSTHSTMSSIRTASTLGVRSSVGGGRTLRRPRGERSQISTDTDDDRTRNDDNGRQTSPGAGTRTEAGSTGAKDTIDLTAESDHDTETTVVHHRS